MAARRPLVRLRAQVHYTTMPVNEAMLSFSRQDTFSKAGALTNGLCSLEMCVTDLLRILAHWTGGCSVRICGRTVRSV